MEICMEIIQIDLPFNKEEKIHNDYRSFNYLYFIPHSVIITYYFPFIIISSLYFNFTQLSHMTFNTLQYTAIVTTYTISHKILSDPT